MNKSRKKSKQKQRSQKSKHRVQAVEHDIYDHHDGERNISDTLNGRQHGRPNMIKCIHNVQVYTAHTQVNKCLITIYAASFAVTTTR